ncbi:MAG: RNA polymerase sigma factor [Armatimonadetes bacterium]|nr:RNA polymerase sigma factor [Armatimonadota bacterium]
MANSLLQHINNDQIALQCEGVSCRKRLIKWSRRYLNSIDDIEDVCQEVCIRCWSERNTFRHKANINTWIYSILINVCKDFLIWKRKHPEILVCEINMIDSKLLELNSYIDSNAFYSSQYRIVDIVQSASMKLTDYQKLLLEWKYIQGFTNAEIAERLGIKKESVSIAIHRSRKAFIKLVRDLE